MARAGDATLPEATAEALASLLLAMADDEFVIGFVDSEWTGIAPLLEEDVAMSSLAQDELGHARALYGLLGDLTGQDPDAIAFDRPPEDFRHARLLDAGRGDWASTVAHRYLYDTADAVRLEALAASSWRPLADLVVKIRREETYHLLHAEAWLLRLADGGTEPRARLSEALEVLGAEAWTVLAPLPAEPILLESGILPVPSSELDERWRARIGPVLRSAGLPEPDPLPVAEAEAEAGTAGGTEADDGGRGRAAGARTGHSEAFRWLHGEFTAVRRLDPSATW